MRSQYSSRAASRPVSGPVANLGGAIAKAQALSGGPANGTGSVVSGLATGQNVQAADAPSNAPGSAAS